MNKYVKSRLHNYTLNYPAERMAYCADDVNFHTLFWFINAEFILINAGITTE